MKLKVYTVFDTVAVEAGPPFTAPNDGVGIRSFNRLMAETPANLRPEYQLWCIGEFDTTDMGMEGKTPQQIITYTTEA